MQKSSWAEQRGCFQTRTANPDNELTSKVEEYVLSRRVEKSVEESRPPLSLDHLHYDVLLQIVSRLPLVTNSPKEPLRTLFALSKVSKNLHEFCKDPRPHGEVVAKIFQRWLPLVQIDPIINHIDFTTSLNLDPKALEAGLGIYFQDPRNGFAKAFALSQEIRDRVTTLVNNAKLKLEEASSPSILYEIKRGFEKHQAPLIIYVTNKKILINTFFTP